MCDFDENNDPIDHRETGDDCYGRNYSRNKVPLKLTFTSTSPFVPNSAQATFAEIYEKIQARNALLFLEKRFDN